jgi:uncharacterized protein (TIRG00374 family)
LQNPLPESETIAAEADRNTSLVWKIVRTLAGLALGLAVAGAAAWLLGVRPDEVAKNLRDVSPWTLVGCALSGFVVFALQALRWYLVMKPLLGLGYWQAYGAQVGAMAFNAVLPARGGDLLRAQYLARRTGKSAATILGTEAVDRWLDWSSWLSLLLVFSLTSTVPRWLYAALGSVSAFLLVWAGVMTILSKLRYVAPRGSRIGALYVAFLAGVVAFRSRRTLLIALLIAPLPWLWETWVLTLLGRAFDFDLPLGTAFSVLIGFNIAMVVPSPGAIGPVEAGGTAALVAAGVEQSKALAYMFVYHFSILLPGIAAGVAILASASKELLANGKMDIPPR